MFTPTHEQQRALELFQTGENLVIQARAGAGKTATLRLLGQSTKLRGQYLAFNKSIVEEAKASMPSNVAASTIHSLAFRSHGHKFKHRLNTARQPSTEVANLIGVQPFSVPIEGGTKVLSAPFLAGRVMNAVERFCQSADEEPQLRHIAYIDGIDMPTEEGERTYDNNNAVSEYLLDYVEAAWEDLSSVGGRLQYGHHAYLKGWQLTDPQLPVEFVLLDEAQDVAPVMDAIFSSQRSAQLVAVGDDAQEIYGFTGAINAMGNMEAKYHTTLSQSFRFGFSIAEVANVVLDELGTARLTGTESIGSVRCPLHEPAAILTRTNAVAVEHLIEALDKGQRPHLLGDARAISYFARAAQAIQNGRRTEHPDLACFDSWHAVRDYVSQDAQGQDLRLRVNLIDKFGVDEIIDALDRVYSEDRADVVISTAHKAKGREWSSVQLASDFAGLELHRLSDPEKRLLYVAVTRAQLALDIDAVPILEPSYA